MFPSLLHIRPFFILLQNSSLSSLSSSMRDKERFIYTVRHGERMDNVDKTWKMSRKEKGEIWDDPPLTDRGLKQASETGEYLSSLPITAVFVSPFTRTIQTATQILNQFNSPPPMYIEPGLAESLNACMDPPGIPSKEQMRKLSPYINFSYTPVYSLPLPRENGGDVGCYARVATTIQSILDNTSGNILIVSHGSPIASSHLYLFSRWAYVGQCTVSTIAYRKGVYVPLSIGDSSHLSNQSNLHRVQSKKGETEKAEELERNVIEERKMAELEGKENA
ncbi:hypothetical protein PRIPAC_87207 [Pristionchus pacificus]|uniref:Uncharacterized protein n=1 Tax=Pristionchus pacificus TaxID=54126 RepID=A0A2A6BZH9_PRIPA|nr:hypothetical protein PRIPAC_87207 [Pristionchus pacificus]|eukprot:PDM71171.1 hypothetical protein PRIPAC_43554 [Pristionchus pacificus]